MTEVKTFEDKLAEAVTKFFYHKSLSPKLRTLIKEWAEVDYFDAWACATDLLDFHGWERRGNRRLLNNILSAINEEKK